ncbi:MAG TPA: LppP/LprE family lipoprotein [Actinomycetota bacterium]|nr:LppP/LprE family lipoprotein [Actinomycetota bacterium]
MRLVVAGVVIDGLLGAAAGLLAGDGVASPPSSASLVQPGTSALATRRADLDGDGQLEVAISSVARAREGAEIPVPRLEVFDHRDGHWVLVLDATHQAPPGVEGTPDTMLASPGPGSPGQIVQVLDVVDFAGDDVPELVAGVLTFGATAGPLELWILSMDEDQFRTEFYEKTERGGRVIVDDREVVLEFGVYEPGDPGCCPSGEARLRIFWDEAAERIVSEPLPDGA